MNREQHLASVHAPVVGVLHFRDLLWTYMCSSGLSIAQIIRVCELLSRLYGIVYRSVGPESFLPVELGVVASMLFVASDGCTDRLQPAVLISYMLMSHIAFQ